MFNAHRLLQELVWEYFLYREQAKDKYEAGSPD